MGILVIVNVGHPTGPKKILKNVYSTCESFFFFLELTGSRAHDAHIVSLIWGGPEVKVFLNCEFSWEKLCEELMKIYMIKSISPSI